MKILKELEKKTKKDLDLYAEENLGIKLDQRKQKVDLLKDIELAIKKKPDLIIMDIQLPDIDGLETTKRIRESKIGEETPIIALTSYAMAGDKGRALAAGCTGYIEKPINPETFMAEIEKHL